ncbi:oligomeric Golgi complex subunit 5-like [Pyrus ussuriensis x Pyrus communis]|uniref:Oligomeric Golgi complex subunit 5-like n=1 Tax=Pyrus ussuriensis x Pyrus communis TaxID=2448454 RepID=A0A5N5I8M2_9ROSA|nr:oligomeric Golgi complex subunit 5-like [Pyrus ussuriensis x Pyrus communis]
MPHLIFSTTPSEPSVSSVSLDPSPLTTPSASNLTKATQLHYEILALYNEYDLAAIDMVDSELEWVK